MTTTFTAVWNLYFLHYKWRFELTLIPAHAFYLDTRYYEVDKTTGNLSLVTDGDNESDPTKEYVSYSHGVYNRNSHGQEILLRPSNVTWRQLGGSIDLYFFPGPTQPEVTSAYLSGAAGFPGMQQYFAFGFHQCRWGYANWSVVQDVVANYAKFGIPLENIWFELYCYGVAERY